MTYLHEQIASARATRMTQGHLIQLHEAAARRLAAGPAASSSGSKIDLSPHEVLALVGEIEEARREAGKWEGH